MRSFTTLSIVVLTFLITPLHAQQWSLKSLPNKIRQVAFSPDSSVMVMSVGTDLMAWNTNDGKEMWKVPIDDFGAQRLKNRCFVGTQALVLGLDGRVISVSVADGKVQDVASNFKGSVEMLYGNVMLLRDDEHLLAIDTKLNKEIFRRDEVKLKWYDAASATIFITAEHELTMINASTGAVNTQKIEPEETYGRARDKVYNVGGYVTLVAENGFYTYEVATGRKTSHIAHDLGDIENYLVDTINATPYLWISREEGHEVYNLANGKRSDVGIIQLPGVVDRFFGTERGLGFVVSYDDDDSMHVGCLDINTGSLRWSRTVGWGKRTYYSGHLYYPSGFTSFMMKLGNSTSAAAESQRQLDMRAMTYNKSTGMMEPDYHKQMMASASGAGQRALARQMQLMTDEARKPIPDLAAGVSPHMAYADANLVNVDDKSATLLIYGGIYRPGVETDFPDGEGLATFDINTGAMSLNHIAIYGNENTAGDFNADHMADVRDMGNGHFCAFGDTAIIYISMKGATRLGFKTKKITIYKGTLDSMWVVDTDPDTDIISYLTIAYDRNTGKATSHLRAQSDIPCLMVDRWPKTDVAFSFVEDNLKIYPTAPSNTPSFEGSTPVNVASDDDIQDHHYADLYDDEEYVPAHGIKVLKDHVVLIGRDATGFFSVKSPGCTTVMETDEKTTKVRFALQQIGSGIARETQTRLRLVSIAADCSLTTTSTLEIDEEHRTYPLRDGVLIVDLENKAVYYYR